MKKIMLLIPILLVLLIIIDISIIKNSSKTTIEVKTKKTQESSIIKDIMNSKNYSQIYTKQNTWHKFLENNNNLIIKDIFKYKEYVYITAESKEIKKKIHIYKIDKYGNIKKHIEITESIYTEINSFILADSIFILSGYKNFKPYILEVDINGNILRSKTLNFSGKIKKIKIDNFDSIYIVGYKIDNNKKIGFMYEINPSLELLNEFNITWYNDEILEDIETDKNYIYLLGNTNSTANNNWDIFIIKLNKLNYNDYSIKKFGSENLEDYAYSFTKDNKYFYIAGYSSPLENYPWKTLIIKTDNNLQKIWRTDYLMKKSSRGLSITQTLDKIAVTGYALEKNNDFDGYSLFIEKQTGIVLFENYYGTLLDERLTKVYNYNDGLIFSGYQKNGEIIKGLIIYTDINGKSNFIK
ncbi:hypothetical protein XO10_06345 [Marinitoga sp. 1135]|uniref:hypothetical protein n=1 Tax=Marinitoga sp. 1135 TaxID=1643333 RepID=UPI001586C701|nr:hypothetical protein [Marinitoga sp. 1135]NUU95897.1 hypothetical protein [Marinitoga sp. 1135]